MKKFLFAVIFLFPTTILADTMCVRDNTLVISLDPSISGTTIYNKGAKWVMEFPYGQIHGEATCLSTTETMGQTNAGKIYGTNEYKKHTYIRISRIIRHRQKWKRTHCLLLSHNTSRHISLGCTI
jgi:hypothetical protein